MQVNQKYLNSKFIADEVRDEVNKGLELLNTVKNPIVSVFGSHKPEPGDKFFDMAREFGFKMGKNGYAIVSGGGPGIMQAANQGATDAGAESIGIKAGLIKGEDMNEDIFTKELSYRFLFVRRFILSIKSDALVFFPGGFGTLNELFEYIVLAQLGFTEKVPMICIDRNFWDGLFKWLESNPKHLGYYINTQKDLGLIQFADTADEAMSMIVSKRST
jgi:uncharacterized protein (TIGR00730 family)